MVKNQPRPRANVSANCSINSCQSSTTAQKERAEKEEAKRQARKAAATAKPEGIYERRQAEKRAGYAPYTEYRNALVVRLSRMWEEIIAVQKDNDSQLHALLSGWPQELRQCEPPEDFSKVPNLDPQNLRILKLVAHGTRRLAEVTTADLAPDVWGAGHGKASRRAKDGIAMLCRLAKGLGNHPRWPKSLAVDLDTSDIGSDAIVYTHNTLHEEFFQVLHESDVISAGLGEFSAEAVLGSGRSLHVKVLLWEEGTQLGTGNMSLKAEAHLTYLDDEPDPGEPRRFEKTVKFDEWFSKQSIGAPLPILEVKRAWSKDIVSHLPAAARASHGSFAGIDITCPCCGHPELLTEIPTSVTCLRCGNDAITGQPLEVLKRAEDAADKIALAICLFVLGVLLFLGFWGYILFAHHFSLLAFALCHLFGAAAIGLGVKLLISSLGQHRQVKAEQTQIGVKFQHPEAVADNQRKIQAAQPVG